MIVKLLQLFRCSSHPAVFKRASLNLDPVFKTRQHGTVAREKDSIACTDFRTHVLQLRSDVNFLRSIYTSRGCLLEGNECWEAIHWCSLQRQGCFLSFFGCSGSSLLPVGLLQLQRVGATLQLGTRASHCTGFPRGGTWAFEPAAFRSFGAWACEVFPDQGSNLCPLYWQADS